MKLSELEKRIKREGGSIKVPDVYKKVKHAPINRLLTGQTPVQAFKKRLTTLLLIFTLLILAVMSIALFAMLNKPDKHAARPSSAYFSTDTARTEYFDCLNDFSMGDNT
jgi:hypothetical protein